MHVVLGVLGQKKIDDVADAFHMQAARCHIRGHQNANMPVTKILKGFDSLILGNFSG